MILPLIPQRQLLDNWCWAAIASSVSYYYFHNQKGWRQGDLGARLLDGSCDINPQNANSAPGECDVPLDIAKPLTLTGNYGGETDQPLSYEDTIARINRGLVICAQIYWPGLESSHFLIIYGYEGNNIIVGDPDPDDGGRFSLDYNELLSDYRGSGEWRRTIGTRPPRP